MAANQTLFLFVIKVMNLFQTSHSTMTVPVASLLVNSHGQQNYTL